MTGGSPGALALAFEDRLRAVGRATMQNASPAELYATLVGGALVIVGMLGFFYEAGFDRGDAVRSSDVLGLLAVNGWHNLLHLVTGAIGLASIRIAARSYALTIGLAYMIVAIWGFAVADGAAATLLELVPVNTADNVLHLLLGLTGLGAGAATTAAVAARPTGAARARRG